jgi:hypothetical protein
MAQWLLFLWALGYFAAAHADCPLPNKFYVDCVNSRSLSDATLFCVSHHMTLLNLTNATGTLSSDMALLNSTFASENCSGQFWFSSGNQTGLHVGISQLDDLLQSLLTGVLSVLCFVPLLCPAATTVAPVSNAITICARPTQWAVIQKCSTQAIRADMNTYQFKEQSMQAGLLDTFDARSLTACSGSCSSNATCVGISHKNGTCNLYM